MDSIFFVSYAACEWALKERGSQIFRQLGRLEAAGNHLDSLSFCFKVDELRHAGRPAVDESPELTRVWLGALGARGSAVP
jgi:hypothetical protein